MLKQKILDLVKEFKGKERDEVYSLLANENEIDNQEKWLVFSYLFPRSILDRQLPSIIQRYRCGYNSMSGFLSPNLGESSIIVEAYRTQQYNRFIRHLIHSFVRDSEKVNPMAGQEECNCSLCDKKIYGFDLWNDFCDKYNNTIERDQKEYLSFMSVDSGLNICKNCLIQLINADQIIEDLEPGYLDFGRRLN